jgi:hypothetical protein
MSAQRICVTPRPTAAPCTAAITGFDRDIRCSQLSSCAIDRVATLTTRPVTGSRGSGGAFMSRPAQNTGPALVMTMAPATSLAFARSTAATVSRYIGTLQALRRSCRS